MVSAAGQMRRAWGTQVTIAQVAEGAGVHQVNAEQPQGNFG